MAPEAAPVFSQAAATVNAALSPCRRKPSLAGREPGQLIAQREIPVDASLLTGARMFRILYTTSGVDENDVQASCGLVLLPTTRQRNQVVAWAHGTVGVHQSCQPSNDPTRFLSGGAIRYGTGPLAVDGSPSQGIWQGLMDEGRMVTATDYYSGLGQSADHQQHYVAGVPAGAAVLDSVRAGIALARRVADTEKPTWRVALWGASQGGHAALWAGQLARDYYRQTALPDQPTIKQVGVVAAVPASSFVATKRRTPTVVGRHSTASTGAGARDSRRLVGRHLADLDMHAALETIGDLRLGATGPILFSQVMTSWARYAVQGNPGRAAAFPGFPRGVRPEIEKVLTGPSDGNGVATANQVVQQCLNQQTFPSLIALTQRFLTDPAANAFFVEPVWGKPDSQGVWEGQLDRTCLSGDGGKGLQKWCRWLAYNMPGPEGVNPFPKIPRKSDGSYAPVLIGQGMDDTLIYCQHPDPTVPPARDCMSRQLYDAFRSHRGMCRTTNLQLDLFAATPSSPASHLSTMYQLADNGKAGYVGSPMDDFLSAAFAGKVTAGCSAEVLNR